MFTTFAMPLQVGTDLTRITFSNHRTNKKRIDDAIGLLGRLNIALPAEAIEAHQRGNELHATRVSHWAESNSAAIAADLAAGKITAAEMDRLIAEAEAENRISDDSARVRRATLRRAGDLAYVDGLKAIEQAAPAILADLRTHLADTIAQQRTHTFLHPELVERYDLVHAAAASIRWALQAVYTSPADDWWRFRHPERVWAWKVEGIQSGSVTGRSHHTTHAPHPVTGRQAFWVYPVTDGPDLMTVAANADDWEPDVLTGHEVIEVHDRLAADPPVLRIDNHTGRAA
jgi:hypothetical protein